MGAPAQQAPFPPEAWPSVELKRFPNNEMGVVMAFPTTPELKAIADIDILSFLIEPQRALRLRKNLDDVLEVMGIGSADMERAMTAEVERCYQLLVAGINPAMKVNPEAYARMVQSMREAALSTHFKMAANTIKSQQEEIDRLRAQVAVKGEVLGGYRG